MSENSSNSRPARTEPSLKQWEALYEVAENLKKLAPWRALRDTDILTLLLPGQDEPVYCSVMGQGDTTYGISIYPGHEAFLRLMRIVEHDGHSPELLMLEQKCLICNFGDRDEIAPEDRAVMKQLGLKFRGHNQWIYFRAMEPGQFPWFLDAEQAELMIAALQNLTMLCLRYLEGKLTVDFDAGQTLNRWYDPEKDMWFNAVIPMVRPKLKRTLELEDELLSARLKRCKKTDARLEMDAFNIPVPVQEDKKSPPVGVHLALIADKNTGLIAKCKIAEQEEPECVIAPALLIEYILECGRPSVVYVRNEWIGSTLRNLCKAVGVRLVEDEGVPLLDELPFERLLLGNGSLDGVWMDDDDDDFE